MKTCHTTLAILAIISGIALINAPRAVAARHPAAQEGTWIARNVRFVTGETMSQVRLHFWTLGSATRDPSGLVRNAVLILHGTGGTGAQFLQTHFADELFGPGQLLDVTKYYIILPDAIGHGQSAKPSDGLRMRFPHYTYEDMVRLQRRLLIEGLGINHLHLVMGTSMGGMHSWMWGYMYPDFMDGLVPLASVPTAIVGRNRIWRKMLMDSIRDDPSWDDGNYGKQPRVGLRAALRLLILMGAVPLQWQKLAPTRDAADAFLNRQIDRRLKTVDANDMIYQFDSSCDYDPSGHLEAIKAPVLAINSADDQINPPELGLMKVLMSRVKRGTYVLIPTSDRTRGHGTHTRAAVWRKHLAAFLASLADLGHAPQFDPIGQGEQREIGSVARQVEALERELIAAIGSRDLAAYNRLVDDDYVALRPASDQTKIQVMNAYRSAALGFHNLDIHNVDVRVFGDTAVVSAQATGTRIEGGRKLPNRVRYLRVWARQGKTWRAVLQMATPLPPG